ncbi:peptidase S53 [Chlorella sorokiniana]|uniref:Peptidase S53 n=1 Tax=Chlorella sorokiniana TaxID=3076 RepID=A0A2P6TV91_CHLSO|nr:peptidase S53 [Chlorella sorokiniana]|eukprot:PRW57964.1 peptidase S53 [Chlorella sorokiniana]
MRRGLLLAALLLGAAAAIAGQEIVLNRGSAGCAQLPPGPPENLRAKPGDGEVTLTWDRPRNGEQAAPGGACVTTYEVMAVPLGRSGRSLGMAPIRSPDYKQSISSLENGQPYRFTVRAFSASFPNAQNNEASVEATPQPPRPTPSLCTRWVRPEAPTNLRVTPAGRGAVKLCWDQPSGPGCADEYRVSVTPLAQGRSFGSNMLMLQSQVGGCVNIDSLVSRSWYHLTVQSWSTLWNGGDSASITGRAG